MGANPVRLGHELERLALWAGEGGEVTSADLDEMVSDTSEAVVWSLADALQAGDPAGALAIAERLIAQGENVTGMIYALASRMRRSGRGDLRGRDRSAGRPRGLVPRRRRLRRRAGADSRSAASGGRCRLSYFEAAAAMRDALAFLRAPVFLWSAPFCTALSIFETSERCSASIALASPPSTALSRRRKWVFTVLRQQPVLGALALAA